MRTSVIDGPTDIRNRLADPLQRILRQLQIAVHRESGADPDAAIEAVVDRREFVCHRAPPELAVEHFVEYSSKLKFTLDKPRHQCAFQDDGRP